MCFQYLRVRCSWLCKMRFSISVWVRQAYCFKVPEFVQTWVAPSTDIAFRLKIHMNSIKMSSRILVTGKNMQEAIEPQDPCLKNRWETLTMYINVFLSWSKMAAVSPIIHCLIATRVFRSVYMHNNINICFRVFCNYYFWLQNFIVNAPPKNK